MKMGPIQIQAKDDSTAEVFPGISMTGTTKYEIEISKCDEGYWFKIHRIDTPQGHHSVRKCLHEEAFVFETEAEAIEAGKLWIFNNT